MRLDQAMGIIAAFERIGVRYVLVGSMAMAAHGLARATRDVDFFVDDDPGNVERIKAALREVFTDDAIDEIRAHDLQEVAVVRYGPPDEDIAIDLISRLGDAFSFADVVHEDILVEGHRVRVATPRMLYEMKRDTVRPQDRADAEHLRTAFGLEM